MVPGRTLHRLAAGICNAKWLERVVEPALADLQNEYAAVETGPVWRRVWILLHGYVVILEVIAMCALEKSVAAGDERQALTRTFLWAVAVTACAFCLLLVLTVGVLPGIPLFYVSLMAPMMLPSAMPIGLTLGIAFALAGRTVTRRMRKTILLGAVLVMIVSFGALAWSTQVAPSLAFRQHVSTALGGRGSVTPGAHEMSVSGIQQRVLAPGGDPMGWPRRLTWMYHLQLAISLAPLVLAMLALAVIELGASRAIVMSACVAYFVLILAGEALVYQGLPPLAGAWLANVALSALTIGLVWCSRVRARRVFVA